MDETSAELRARASALRDIIKQSRIMPQQKLIGYCMNTLKEVLKKLSVK